MNGLIRAGGESVKFKMPVLTLGSGADADVNIPGTAALHGLIAPTPFGPALRAFAPVIVNGQETAAALLKQGDTLNVGGEEYTIGWDGWPHAMPVPESPDLKAEREAIEADKEAIQAQWTALQARLDEAKEIREKARADAAKYLKEQRAKFTAEVIAHRLAAKETQELQDHLELCMSQLHEAQERFAAEYQAKAAEFTASEEQLQREIATAKAEIHAKQAEQQAKLECDLAKARAEFQKDLESLHQHRQQAEADLQAEREKRLKDVLEAEAQLQAKVNEANEALHQHKAQTLAQLQAEQERNRQDAEATNLRIASAWEMVTATQKQMAEEKAQFQQAVIAEKQKLEAFLVQCSERERAVQSHEAAAQAKLAAMRAEAAALEQKMAQVKQQRVEPLLPTKAASTKNDWYEPVPLNVKHDPRGADQFLHQLQQQERELAAERQRLAALAQNNAAEREQLHEQKQAIAEQMRQLEATRRQWKANENQTLNDLESLARSIAQREAELEARLHRSEPAVLSFMDATRNRQSEAVFQYPRAA